MKTPLLLTGLLASAALAAAPQQRPNVLMILSDDHSVPYAGCYGNPDIKTPNLDRLAAEGVRFNRFYDAAPQSVPSRAAIMTGRNVVDVQMLRFTAPLPREYVTYPELLRAAGYYVGVCGRTYHLDGSASDAPESVRIIDSLGLRTFPDRYQYVKTGGDPLVLMQAQEFLSQVPKGAPFCLWANYSDPHHPWTATEFEPDPATITVPSYFPDAPAVREGLSRHYGEIMRLDQNIGKLIAMLETRGLLDNTIILFAGDNGAALPRGKGSLFDCGIHVPCIVRYPAAVKAGTVSDVLLSSIDVAPTMLDLCGVEPDPKMEGKSFAAALKGGTQELHDYVFAVRCAHGSGLPGKFCNTFDEGRTVFDKDFKLIYNAIWQVPYAPVDIAQTPFWTDLEELNQAGKIDKRFSFMFAPTRPMFQLFDLRNDPDELVNLAGKPEYAEAEHRLKTALQCWMIIYRDHLPTPIPGGKKAPAKAQ